MKDQIRSLLGGFCWVALGLAPISTVRADLVFDTTEVSLDAEPSDATVSAEFSFKNSGKEAVEVTEVKTTCGCLKAVSDKPSYAPGESGKISAVFSTGRFKGVQTKALNVMTRSGESAPERIQLKVTVDIPPVITIEPNLVEWKVGEEATSKKFTIKVPHTDPVRIKTVKPSRQNFVYELKEIVAGRHYEIFLTPDSTEQPMLGVLKIETDCAIEKHRRQLAFFSINRPRPAAKETKTSAVPGKTASNS